MKLVTTSGIFVFAGLLATGASNPQEKQSHPEAGDTRLAKLKKFFADRACPLEKHAAAFLAAADENNLDWRLLPSISFVESGGGKAYRNNNVLGWDSSKYSFPSITAGIHAVARRLSNSRLYKDKNLDGVLRTYNPVPDYGNRVKAVMRTLGSIGVGTYASMN
jgi:hypothetical protein